MTPQQLYDTYFPGNTGQSWTYGSVHGSDVEQGTDIFMPVGAPVALPAAATLVWTNGYQSVFQLASGLALNVTHIIATAVTPGAQLGAGTVIGTVAPLSATPPGYFSSAPHIELGVYNTPQDAINWVDSATHDPVAWLASLGGGNRMPGDNGGSSGSGPTVVHGFNGETFTYDPKTGKTTIGNDAPAGPLGALTTFNAGHFLLVALLGIALIGVVLVLLGSLAHKAGVVPVPG